MNLSNLSKEERADVERRILKLHGKIVDVKYTDLETQTVEVTEEDGKVTKSEKLVPVERVRQYYIGKMGAGQTGGILAILGAVLMNGQKLKDLFDISHNLVFLEVLSEENVIDLLSVIMGGTTESAFVKENFDLDWASDVFETFFTYNSFFELGKKIWTMLQKNGITEEQVRTMAMGAQSSASATTKPSKST